MTAFEEPQLEVVGVLREAELHDGRVVRYGLQVFLVPSEVRPSVVPFDHLDLFQVLRSFGSWCSFSRTSFTVLRHVRAVNAASAPPAMFRA